MFVSPVNIFIFLFDLSTVTSKNETVSIHISSSISMFYPIKSKVIHRYRAIIFHLVFFLFFLCTIHISFIYSLCVSSFDTCLYELKNKIDCLSLFYCLQKKKKEKKKPFFFLVSQHQTVYIFFLTDCSY